MPKIPVSPELPWLRVGDTLFDAGDDIHLNAQIPLEHPSFIHYSTGYRQAAEAVVEAVRAGQAIVDFCIYPIVYLYRHYVELRLKEIILYGKQLLGEPACFPMHHDLVQLWHERRKVLAEAKLGPAVGDDKTAEELVRELASADPKSFTFRYPVDTSLSVAMPSERVINVRILKETMERLGNFLDSEVEFVLTLQNQPRGEDWS